MGVDNIKKMYDDAIAICNVHRCDKWSNSWIWGGITHTQQILHYYLIEADYENFKYQDLNDTSIEIKYRDKEYRIDVKARYQDHYYWYFKEKDWIFVSTYVKKMIQQQFDSIEKFYSSINLLKDIDKLYDLMNKDLRKEKLKKINGKK